MAPRVAPLFDVPRPPRDFRGAFLTDPGTLDRTSGASGPFRLLPAAVAIPVDTADVAVLVTWAAKESFALVPRGAGTGMPGGNVGRGVVVDLTALSAVRVTDAGLGILEAGPGATGRAVEEAAGALSRFFPPLPSSAHRCTTGGMVANNAAGARTFGYGSVHAWVEEVEMVMADGTVERFAAGSLHPRFTRLRADLLEAVASPERPWPAVRKNASGYALDRFLPRGEPLQLLVGSEGTLGVLTRVRLRTAPLPPCRAVAVLPLPDRAALDASVPEITALGAVACEFFGERFLDIAGLRTDEEVGTLLRDHPMALLVEVDGARDAVEGRLAALEGLARGMGLPLRIGKSAAEQERLWRIRHAASPVVAARADHGQVSMQFIEDSVVPIGCLAPYLEGLDAILGDEETDAVVFGHAGDANVHVNPLVDVRRPDWRARVGRILERTVTLVAELGGTLSGEHGDGRLRAPFHPRIFGPQWAATFERVKHALDPLGILNPGVVVPVVGQDPLDGLSPERRIG